MYDIVNSVCTTTDVELILALTFLNCHFTSEKIILRAKVVAGKSITIAMLIYKDSDACRRLEFFLGIAGNGARNVLTSSRCVLARSLAEESRETTARRRDRLLPRLRRREIRGKNVILKTEANSSPLSLSLSRS